MLFDIDFLPQGQFYRVLSCFRIRPVIITDICIPYWEHWFITMRGCVAYIHGPDTMLTIDLKAWHGFVSGPQLLCFSQTMFGM